MYIVLHLLLFFPLVGLGRSLKYIMKESAESTLSISTQTLMVLSYWGTVAITKLLRLVNPFYFYTAPLGPAVRSVSLILFIIIMPLMSLMHATTLVTAISLFGLWLFFCDRCFSRTQRKPAQEQSDGNLPGAEIAVVYSKFKQNPENIVEMTNVVPDS